MQVLNIQSAHGPDFDSLANHTAFGQMIKEVRF